MRLPRGPRTLPPGPGGAGLRGAGRRDHAPPGPGLPGQVRPWRPGRPVRPRLGWADAAGRTGRRDRHHAVGVRRGFRLSLVAFLLGFPQRMAASHGWRPRLIGMVLAAGAGRRLRPDTAALPKVLAAVGVRAVVIVVGSAADAIRDRAARREQDHGVGLTLVDNDRAEEWNNAYSLWLAREHFAAGGAPGNRPSRQSLL